MPEIWSWTPLFERRVIICCWHHKGFNRWASSWQSSAYHNLFPNFILHEPLNLAWINLRLYIKRQCAVMHWFLDCCFEAWISETRCDEWGVDLRTLQAQSQHHHTPKHTLLCHLFFSKWDRNLPNKTCHHDLIRKCLLRLWIKCEACLFYCTLL